MPDVEFLEWDTPFKDDCLWVMDVQYSNGSLELEKPKEGLSYKLSGRSGIGACDLLIRLFSENQRSVFRLVFRDVLAFRVLDENGLLQLWDATAKLGNRPSKSTFKVRNHLWAKESILSFNGAQDGWSYMVATDAECVEVICWNDPTIVFEEKVEPVQIGK